MVFYQHLGRKKRKEKFLDVKLLTTNRTTVPCRKLHSSRIKTKKSSLKGSNVADFEGLPEKTSEFKNFPPVWTVR
jgi:hypothetical protein